MWVKVPNEEVKNLKPDTKVRVMIPHSPDYTGTVLKVEHTGKGGNDPAPEDVYVRLVLSGHTEPVSLYAFANRKWYRWVEDEPSDSVNQLDVDQSALRLRNPERAKKLHAHVGEIIKEQENPPLKAYVRVNGTSTYAVQEGEHLRVWWEDGRLHTEYVQGENK